MASSNISFDNIPASIRKPGKYFEFNTKLAVRTLATNTQTILIIAPRTAEGTLAPLTPVSVYSDVEARIHAGPGSIGHLMTLAAIRAYPYARITLITIDDDAASLAATGSLSLTGQAVSAGVLSLSIAGVVYRVAVGRGTTPAEALGDLATVITQGEQCPVTATLEGASLTLTAKNKGETGNFITLSVDETIDGMGAAITPMSGGQVNADLTPALSACFAAGHTILVTPYTDQAQLEAVREHLAVTGGPMEQRGAIGVAAVTSTLAKACTIASKVNSGRVTMAVLPGTATPPWQVAAAYAAVLASEEDPARPLNTLALTGVAPPDFTDRLGRTEQETALYSGLTPLEVGPGDVVQIVRALSTYIKDAQGIDDVSLLDITTIRTLDYVRKACRERISLRFPREKLSSRTARKVRSELLDVLYKLEELEIVEEVLANKNALVVERDLQDVNRLNAAIPADVVNGLHVFAGRIDLLL